jgi:hypothetical protein
MILYGLYSDIAWGQYLENKSLMDTVHRRYEDISGWHFGAALGHVPTMGLDYLHEAYLAHSFGFFRSSIFCCSSALDFELKRSLAKAAPFEATRIEGQTFGQSVRFAHKCRPSQSTRERLTRLEEVNQIRNRVSVHPCQINLLASHDEDDGEFPIRPPDLKQFFSPTEIKRTEDLCSQQDIPLDWLEQLSAKVIWMTKKIFGCGPLVFGDTGERD